MKVPVEELAGLHSQRLKVEERQSVCGGQEVCSGHGPEDKNKLGDLSVRARKMPKLNLKATSLRNLIVWDVEEVHEPAFTCKLNTEELKALVENRSMFPSSPSLPHSLRTLSIS